RFPRVLRADGARRPRARGELRRPFPRGVPDARRRGGPQRRGLHPRGGLGVPGRGQGAPPPHRAADLRVRRTGDQELQVKTGTMNVRLRVWRQKDARSAGQFVTYEAKDVSPDMSFLEMLDAVNEDLIEAGEEPIA